MFMEFVGQIQIAMQGLRCLLYTYLIIYTLVAIRRIYFKSLNIFSQSTSIFFAAFSGLIASLKSIGLGQIENIADTPHL